MGSRPGGATVAVSKAHVCSRLQNFQNPCTESMRVLHSGFCTPSAQTAFSPSLDPPLLLPQGSASMFPLLLSPHSRHRALPRDRTQDAQGQGRQAQSPLWGPLANFPLQGKEFFRSVQVSRPLEGARGPAGATRHPVGL